MSNSFADIIKSNMGTKKAKTSVSKTDDNAQLVQEIEKNMKESLKIKSFKYIPDAIHASQIYKECPRKWWLLRKAGEEHESMSVGCGLGVCFDIGNALHKMVQELYFGRRLTKVKLIGHWRCKWCATMYQSIENQTSLYPGSIACCKGKGEGFSFVEPKMRLLPGKLPLVGKCDGVIAVDDDPWAILEIKTANDWSFTKDPETWDWWPGYLWQAHAYMKGFGLDRTLFMIINKAKQGGSKLPIKFKLVEFDESIWREVENRAHVLNEIQDGDWDSYKMTDLPKTCKAGTIDKNCPVAVECSKGLT